MPARGRDRLENGVHLAPLDLVAQLVERHAAGSSRSGGSGSNTGCPVMLRCSIRRKVAAAREHQRATRSAWSGCPKNQRGVRLWPSLSDLEVRSP